MSRTLRILVADDDALAADELAGVLRREGHSVRVENDGLAALDAAHLEQFAVAVLDIEMPNFSGHEVARIIRQRSPSTVLIALSGHGSAEMVNRSAKAGFHFHFAKPTDFEEIARTVGESDGKRSIG